MSTLVIDASVLVALVSDTGPDGSWAESVMATATPVAPHLARVEATNILRRLELTQRLAPAEADSARQLVLDLDLEIFPFEPFAERIWQLRANVTSYDAWYVAIAEALEAPLATLDFRLAEASGPRCEFSLPSRRP